MANDINETLKERGARYGDYVDQANISDAIISALRKGKSWQHMPAFMRQSLIFIAVKMGRIVNGDPLYPDNWHDIKGFATLAEDRLPEYAWYLVDSFAGIKSIVRIWPKGLVQEANEMRGQATQGVIRAGSGYFEKLRKARIDAKTTKTENPAERRVEAETSGMGALAGVGPVDGRDTLGLDTPTEDSQTRAVGHGDSVGVGKPYPIAADPKSRASQASAANSLQMIQNILSVAQIGEDPRHVLARIEEELQ